MFFFFSFLWNAYKFLTQLQNSYEYTVYLNHSNSAPVRCLYVLIWMLVMQKARPQIHHGLLLISLNILAGPRDWQPVLPNFSVWQSEAVSPMRSRENTLHIRRRRRKVRKSNKRLRSWQDFFFFRCCLFISLRRLLRESTIHSPHQILSLAMSSLS